MKTQKRLIIAVAIALGMGSCTTGSFLTSSNQDDIYFNPGDVPPPISIVDETPAPVPQNKSGENMVISQMKGNEDGSKTLNNYVLNDNQNNADAQVYSMDPQNLTQSDTTIYYNDDQVKYVINNYYDSEDLDYAFRIRRFHDPYFYDPYYWDSWGYWDNWYSPYYSFGWGYNSWYSPFNYGYYSPWGYGYGWYSPYYSYYNSWYYGGYYGGWDGYYNGYYGDWGGGAYYSDNYSYGRRRNSNTNILAGSSTDRRMGTSLDRQRDIVSKSANPTNPEAGRTTDHSTLRANSVSGATRGENSVSGGNSRTTNSSNQVLVERRRSNASASDNGRQAATIQRETTRTQSGNDQSGTRRVYDNNDQQSTPNYQRSNTQSTSINRPSTSTSKSGITNTQANRANYNRQIYTRPSTSINYSTPRVVTNSSSGNSNSTPQSTTNYNRTYRSSSTYNSSSSVNSGRSYSSPSPSSSGSYQPSRSNSSSYSSGSSSSGSYSSGSSSSSSYSSGGSSGSSNSSGGGSSHSGRR